ncbi:MAG: SPFH domain-containing protein [Ardenticatenaceae bacterium]|nr:SPFH domain-containing protein [Ardenticatenaceae bacterium]
MLWVIVAGLVIGILTFILLWAAIGLSGLTIFTALLMGLIALIIVYRFAYVHLNEMEVGVIFRRDGNFSRFLQPGHHFINPFLEYQDNTIPKGPQTTIGIAKQIRTKEGIPVTIHWNVSFFIDVTKIRPGIENKMARALPKYAVNMIGGRVLHSLRHTVENMGIEDLHTNGAIQKLEDVIGAEVHKRAVNLGVLPIMGNDMKLGPIEMPPQVEKALEANYERQLTVEALKKLQEVIDKFTDAHMEKLGELERLRILDNGDRETLFYVMDSTGGGRPPRGSGAMGPRNGRPLAPGSDPMNPDL